MRRAALLILADSENAAMHLAVLRYITIWHSVGTYQGNELTRSSVVRERSATVVSARWASGLTVA